MNDSASAEGAVTSRVMRRLLPFLLLMYVLAFLDRANIGFAQKALQQDTGLTNAAFAFGAGVFFVGYALFEVPSNLLLHRVGAKLWLCRIMVTWGLVSAGMAFAHTAAAFHVLRFLLGVAEAGFFPGIVYYLTRWFPQSSRARALGVFYFGAPLAFIFGAPLSGLLLDLHGALGFKGWQWLFLIEGLLASIVGAWAFWYLDDDPAKARWLTNEQRALLVGRLADDARAAASHGPRRVLAALVDPRVLVLCCVYFLIQAAVYGVVFYLPQQVSALLGAKVGFRVGLVTALPWIAAVIVTWIVPRHADRTGRHRLCAVALLAMSGVAIAVSGLAGTPVVSLIALCCAASGFIAAQPLFWTFPTRYLTGAAAAAGIALINSLGGLGGFFAPLARTAAEAAFHSTSAGLMVLAGASVLAALIIILMVRTHESSPIADARGKPAKAS
ncbi:MFS transporter [Caballeronia ptereochthonis]|uniref:Major facilitator transporter n=1 Tax=Caballeronia ptereochthonis TaxID=1777144 RepID=A0A158D1U9_9BURK|nr:MFS transporter [Caballeronia ptereochthonis]SAK88539.1 major facilitator transporter [Caballeronia ptereochthonis]